MKNYDPSKCVICGEHATEFPYVEDVDDELATLFKKAFEGKLQIPLCNYHRKTHTPGVMKGTR